MANKKVNINKKRNIKERKKKGNKTNTTKYRRITFALSVKKGEKCCL